VNERSVVVSTWGNPFIWKEADYKLSGSGINVKGVTTLYLLIKAFSPDLVLVMVPETLLCVKRIEEYDGKTISQEITNEDYEKLIYGLKKAVKNFFVKNIPRDVEVKKFRVVVMPNIGEYSDNVRVEWKLPEGKNVNPDSVYAAHALISLLSSLMEMCKDIDVIYLHFDITHGVNFMPLAAYRALRVASRVISALYGLRVEFKQYNSTPYPITTKVKNFDASSEYIPNLEVFIVKEETITPVKAAQRLVYSYLSRDEIRLFRFHKEFEDKVAREIEKFNKEFNEIYRNAKPLVSSIHYSMPLAFIQFSKENEEHVMKLEEYIKKIEELIEENFLNINITKTDIKMCIEHKIVPSYEDLKSLLSALSLISYGSNSIKNLSKIRFQNGIIEVSLSELKNVMKYLQGPLIEVAKHEVANFERNRFTEELKEIVKQAKENKGNWKTFTKKCEDVKRIIIAHAGLASRSIEVMFNDEMWIRYRKECLKHIREIVGNALNDTRKIIKGEGLT